MIHLPLGLALELCGDEDVERELSRSPVDQESTENPQAEDECDERR
jgi:hypothetical protein